MRRLLKILTGRMMIVTPLIILQFALIVAFLYHVNYVSPLLPLSGVVGVLCMIHMMSRDIEPSARLAWAIAVLGVPIIGIPLYLLFAGKKMPKQLRNGTTRAAEEMNGLMAQDPEVREELQKSDPSAAMLFEYGLNANGFPVYSGTRSRYFSSGEEWFEVYKKQLRSAKTFILMEYFIIDDGSVWQEVLEILKEKAAEGVSVKLIYDDFGSILMPWKYDQELRKYGIDAYKFNKVRPAFIVQMNNRSHRKITVIDNRTAFTGGVNLADEYVNRISRFGYWKDSAVMIEGEAVWSLTVMFMGMYSYLQGNARERSAYERYRLPSPHISDGGYYQPYSDSPTDGEPASLNMHLNIVKYARKYIYIDTPYLILTESMKEELILAAKSGVDVRILVPHIPDKFLVNQITKGYYRVLLEGGVRIYEYTPGFDHAKNFVCDDSAAIIGTANTDYRSYFLHFENGILMHHTPEIIRIREDFEASIAKSQEITLEDVAKTNVFVRIFRVGLAVFIPLV